MIKKVHGDHPELSIEQLCHLFEVSRSWYYEHRGHPENDEEETALRDRIEEIILSSCDRSLIFGYLPAE